jgi:hypothetical protein
MPLEFQCRHPTFALHDIKQRFDPEEQGGLRGLKDGARPETELAPTAFTLADFRASTRRIKLFRVTLGAIKVFALKATAPQQGPGLCFRGDFGKKSVQPEKVRRTSHTS